MIEKESQGSSKVGARFGAKFDQSLRSIAILLHTLPSRTHRALIGQLDVEAKRKVARELELIGEVDVFEQHRVLSMMLDQLHAETDRVKKVESEIQDEIFIGRARVAKKTASPLASALHADAEASLSGEGQFRSDELISDGQSSPVQSFREQETGIPGSGSSVSEAEPTELGFLAEMQINDAAMLLANESAQTIAIALSSLPEHTASMLLPKMSGHLQEEAVRRMEQIDVVPPQAASEVAAHLKRQMMMHESTVQTSGVHQPHLPVTPQPVSSLPVSESGAMIYQFPRYTNETSAGAFTGTQAFNEPRLNDQASGLTEQLSRQPAQPTMQSSVQPQSRVAPAGQPAPGQPAPGQQASEGDAARADRALLDLPPQTLCRALGYATTRQAFLVLCGLPNEHAEMVLGMLPKRKARKVQSDMRRMGKLHLSEIDEAKKAVAEIAVRIAIGDHEMHRRGAVA